MPDTVHMVVGLELFLMCLQDKDDDDDCQPLHNAIIS